MGAWEFNTNRWKGSVSTDFATAANWTSGAVPLEGVPIVFAIDPDRDCYLDSDRTVSDILNSQSTYNLIVNGHSLTITGTLFLTNGAQIDARMPSSSIIFNGNDPQTITNGAFTDNTIPDLTIDNINRIRKAVLIWLLQKYSH
jgi:hypothetical protein